MIFSDCSGDIFPTGAFDFILLLFNGQFTVSLLDNKVSVCWHGTSFYFYYTGQCLPLSRKQNVISECVYLWITKDSAMCPLRYPIPYYRLPILSLHSVLVSVL